MALLLSGCDIGTNDKVDTEFLCPDCPVCPPVVVCDDNDSIHGYLTELEGKVDVSTVKMNHYVDQVLLDENMAELIEIDGEAATKNKINFPAYPGTPLKHTLVIEFMQTN